MSQLTNLCQRSHQNSQQNINALCLNKDCQFRLLCNNCLSRRGYHYNTNHREDVIHFEHLIIDLEEQFNGYRNTEILNLIHQKSNKFKDAKSEIIKTLNLLETEFEKVINRAIKTDQMISECIQMVETKNFLQFKEIQVEVIVDLYHNQMTEKLKNSVISLPIIEELENFNQILMSKLEQNVLNEFLKKHCSDAHQLEIFKQKRPDFDSEIFNGTKIMIEGVAFEQKIANQFYLGGLQNNCRHGRGILIDKDIGEITEGIWENNTLKWGLKIGKQGELDVIYIGQYKKGKFEGKGIYEWSDGKSYEGDYVNHKREGKGIYKWPDGRSYEGDYVNGKRDGKGIYKWPDGRTYVGDYKNGIKEGMGIQKWENGDSYEGGFKNDNFQGKGIYKWFDGRIYEGEYNNGKKEGKGIFKWPDGRIYEGDYKNEKKDGKGVYTLPNGEIEEGIFKEGLSIGEHKVYKQNALQPYKIKVYGENGIEEQSYLLDN